ncbi:secretion protein HlyD family protein [Chthoniobacter flavus Ellin428]|uniref:Secretion protein HlyD family protein n=1 Tax=Chthoniobacter flavus Ellin428 TaxID=497964 RepID=B4DAL0_9BACT|nr:HlyD family secretion protein [Chthoniobacter flavus]EDY16528.1 secretion protein HlyD family protein [Chthoniobacter flavus Ellin428]TCO85214.1 membrane fusion protein (multidrug efflux system) [Chthoniobacter flavus]
MDTAATPKSGPSETTKPATESAPAASTPPAQPKSPLRSIIVLVIVLVVLFFGGRFVYEALNTTSTDDAYVNSHVTFVAPRVAGQVAKVLVDDNNRVHKGDVIVVLDKEPYQVQVAIKQAALDTAQADLIAAQATVRGQVAQARSARYKLQHTIEDVDNKIAVLRANAAALAKSKSSLELAKQEFDRYQKLLTTRVASKEEFDQRKTTYDSAQAEVNQATENVIQSRVNLGLPAKPADGQPLTDVPEDLPQTFSSVRQAQADLLQSAAQISIFPSSYKLTPKEMVDEFYRRDPSGDIDVIYSKIIKDAPTQKQAAAKLLQAQHDLEDAELNLRYCDIVAEIDGIVTRRNVNPGNNVQVGQSLMAIRSLTEVWIDANFKETQLSQLRIGLPVDIHADMYGKRHVFKGRISGFTMGTGSTLSLLPAENATGNFVKVVQRLPVRIDLIDYNPDVEPLFVGVSVEPVVRIKEAPTGPDAGKFLQPYAPAAGAAVIAPATPTPEAKPAVAPVKP